jgi:hypothetical protein
MLQKLIYSIFVFMSSKFHSFYVFLFRIIRGGGLERPAEMQASQAATSPRFGRTCYGTTVVTFLTLTRVHMNIVFIVKANISDLGQLPK